jgi:hypothetical protein
MRIPSICLALMSLFCATAPAAFAAEDCKLGLIADLRVAFGPQGGTLLPVTVRGKDAWMILGLNSGISGVFPVAAQELGLEPLKLKRDAGTGSHLRKDADIIKSGRKDLNLYVKFDAFKLGQVDLAGFEAIIMADGPAILPVFQGRPIIGRIGSGLFRQFDVELDFGHDALRMFRANTCKSPPVYWASDYTVIPLVFDAAGTLTFVMDLDGHRIRTSLATDVARSMLEDRATERFFGFKPDAPELERIPLPGGQRAVFRAMSVNAEGVAISNARVQLYDRPDTICKLGRARDDAIAYVNCSNITPFSLGTDVLKRLRLLVGSKREEIYVTTADASLAPRS